MRRNGCKTHLASFCILTCCLAVCHILWSFLQVRSLPAHFDPSMLDSFKYLNGISEHDVLEPLDRYGYDIIASHNIEPLRSVRDTRHVHCKTISSSTKEELPSTSVIVTFKDVDRSVLLRNVVSILSQSGRVATIVEIILVDDGSQDELDGSLLGQFPGVKVIRNENKKGRGIARIQGASVARGEILAFVDSLVEVNVDWLSPLVLRLTQFPKAVVSPAIDWIDHMTFEYSALPGLFQGVFDWNLQFHWEEVPTKRHSKQEPTQPYRSPVLSGNVFAIRRDVFFYLGAYDSNDGARETEDIEFSLRVWMCGGHIEVVPCSRVGLIQSKAGDLARQEVSFNSYVRSARRVAEVWLEEYKRFFYSTRPSARMQLLSDVSSQRKLKERLRCKSFKWFITSVYPQLQPLIRDEVAFGYIRQNSLCLDVDPGQLPLVAKLRECQTDKTSQDWSWRKRGVIVTNGMCLTADLLNMQGYVSVQFCKDINLQVWYRHQEKIVHHESNLCLDGSHGQSTGLIISHCIKDDPNQHWQVEREITLKDSRTEDYDDDEHDTL